MYRHADGHVGRDVRGGVDGHVDRHVDRHVDGRVDGHVDGHVDGRVDGHVDRHMDRHVDRHMDRYVGRSAAQDGELLFSAQMQGFNSISLARDEMHIDWVSFEGKLLSNHTIRHPSLR